MMPTRSSFSVQYSQAHFPWFYVLGYENSRPHPGKFLGYNEILCELDLPWKLLVSLFLIVLTSGFVTAELYLKHTTEMADGKEGLSMDDITITFHGSDMPRLKQQILGPMKKYFTESQDVSSLKPNEIADIEKVVAWIDKGAPKDEYQYEDPEKDKHSPSFIRLEHERLHRLSFRRLDDERQQARFALGYLRQRLQVGSEKPLTGPDGQGPPAVLKPHSFAGHGHDVHAVGHGGRGDGVARLDARLPDRRRALVDSGGYFRLVGRAPIGRLNVAGGDGRGSADGGEFRRFGGVRVL